MKERLVAVCFLKVMGDGGGSRARAARGAGFRTRLNIAYGCGHKLRERPAERCVFYFFPEIIHSYITIKWQRIVFLRFSGVFRIFYRNGWGGVDMYLFRKSQTRGRSRAPNPYKIFLNYNNSFETQS